MKRKLILSIAIFTLIVNSIVAQDSWTLIPEFPGGPRFGSIGIGIGNKGYVGLGAGDLMYNDFWEYDATSDTWTKKADFPALGRQSGIAFAVNNKIYIGLGIDNYTAFNDLYEYDPATNTWTQKADYPGGVRYGSMAFNIGNKGYVGCGKDEQFYLGRNDFYEYDPATDVWTKKADVGQVRRSSGVGFSIGNKGYIGLGVENYDTRKKDLWEYDPATNAWVQKADLPGTQRYAAVAFSIGSKGYVGTGYYFTPFNDMWEYDPATDSWAQKADAGPTPRGQGIGFNIGNKGYVGLGYNSIGLLSDLWEYTPSAETHLPALYFDPIAVSTFAGNGDMGFEDGLATSAKFNFPTGVAADHAGNVYVADAGNNRIRKITPAGVVSTIAGSGIAGFVNGNGIAAQFNYPNDVAVDASGNVYVSDEINSSIRKITPVGIVSTLAGNGTQGFADGNGTAAKFSLPRGVAVDASGNVYVADVYNNRVRKILQDGEVTTFAGDGIQATTDGTGTNAQLNNPGNLALDVSGNLFVTETYGHLRKITTLGVVSTINPPGMIGFQFGVVADPHGNIYVSLTPDPNHNYIYKITSAGVAEIIAGSTNGFQDGIGIEAQFASPGGLSIDDSGSIYVADPINNRIRKISVPQLSFSTEAGTPSPAQFFKVSGDNLPGNATLTAPEGFEISLTAGSGYASALSILQVSGEIVSVPIYIRLNSSVGAGNYTGNITLSSAGAITQSLSVTGTVTDTVPPVIQCPPAQTLCFKNSNIYTVPNLTATDISGIQTITYSITGATNRNGTGANASGLFNPGISTIKWIVTDGAGNSSSCQTSIRVDMPLYVSIPNVYPLLFWGQVNTLYIGFGPACVTLTALPSGGTRLQNRYNYAWSTGSTTKSITVCRDVAGSYVYTVTVTDSLGCQATASKTINVIDVRCGQNLKKVWVCWFGNYQYCVTEGQAALALLFGAKLGTCNSADVSSANGSRNNSEEASVIADKKITVFPNPNNGSFTVLLNNLKTSEIRILDQNGKIISRRMVNGMNKSQTINMNPGVIAKGMYVVQAISKDGVYTCKMMVQ